MISRLDTRERRQLVGRIAKPACHPALKQDRDVNPLHRFLNGYAHLHDLSSSILLKMASAELQTARQNSVRRSCLHPP